MKKNKKELESRQIKRLEYWNEKQYKLELLKSFPKTVQKVIESEDFPIIEDFTVSLFYHGNSRTGKTTNIYRRIIKWHLSSYINFRETSFNFFKVPMLLDELRNMQNDIERKKEFIESLKRCRLLVLDDLGACQMTDWATQMMYMIIDFRYEEEKTTWYTSNFDLPTLAEMTGDDRLVGRIVNHCKGNIIEFVNTPFL